MTIYLISKKNYAGKIILLSLFISALIPGKIFSKEDKTATPGRIILKSDTSLRDRYVVDTLESHVYTIRNRMTSEYLCISDTQVVCKMSPDSLSKRWIIARIKQAGGFWIINQKSKTYINSKNHKPYMSDMKLKRSAPRWTFEKVENTGYYRIRNYTSGTYLNNADVFVKSTMIASDWESAMWIIEKQK